MTPVASTRPALTALLVGAFWTAFVAVIDHFSSRVHLSHLILAGIIFTAGAYVVLQRSNKQRQRRLTRSTDTPASSDDDS